MRSLLLDFGQWIGALRLISSTDDLHLRFDEDKFADFISARTAKVEPAELIEAIKNHSGAHHLQNSSLLAKLHEILAQNHAHHELACGHDLATILGQWLRGLIGSCKATDVSREKIESYLRLGYERDFFETTQLYKEMREWEAKLLQGRLLAY